MQVWSAPPLILTNCTGRKRRVGPVVGLPDGLRPTSVRALAESWRSTLQRATTRLPARSLYAGRSVADAIKSSTVAGGELLVVSAGLGLVHSEDVIPAYDLTVAEGVGMLSASLRSLGVGAGSWWRELADIGVGRGLIAQQILLRRGRVALIALPSTYLEMVREDLDSLGDADLERVRIFTSSAGRASLPERLRSCALPYDSRLESIPGYAGTTVDYPQRALRHFVECLRGHLLGTASAGDAVEAALEGLSMLERPARARLSDEAIARVIKEHWCANGGSSTRLLRFVRREAGIACEQSRFRDIWRDVRADLLREGRLQ